MKRLWQLAILVVSVGFFTSCDPEPVDPVIDDNFAPSISFLADNPNPNGGSIFSADASITLEEGAADGSTIVFVAVEGSDSTPDLSNLSIERNGEKPDGFIFRFTDQTGTEITVNNPALLVGDYAQGFRWEIGLRTAPEFGENTFRFVLTDAGNLEAETSLTITTAEYINPGTDITGNLSGVLLNQAGPSGTGGLDLDNGEGLGSADAAIEIKDNGIDNALPAASNWKKTISAANGTVIKYIDRTALGESYDFTTVTTKEEITAAWDTGIALAGANTDVLVVGDELVVSSQDGSFYYLLQVVEVNNTSADNADNYVFNIKY